jgi:hypothetical protein
MALELLRRIAARPLPCTIEALEEILLLRALRASGLVQASIPQSMRVNGRPYQLPATVHLITREGWEALVAASPARASLTGELHDLPQQQSAVPRRGTRLREMPRARDPLRR